MTRYSASRRYRQAGLAALGFAVLCAWWAIHVPLAAIAAVLFLASAVPLLLLGLQSPIEIHETHLAVGRRITPWADIRRVDRVNLSPLLVRLTLAGNARMLLIYAGDLDSCNSLLRHIRRSARHALIEGQEYRQFWGEPAPAPKPPAKLVAPKYLMLRPEDEAEVERMYQRLKTVGHLDPKRGPDEK